MTTALTTRKKDYDAIVVGAGPAGAAAALLMARAGMRVLLLERGEYPGAKNVSGAAFYGSSILHEVIPSFWEEAPVERILTKRTLAFMSPESSVAVDFQTKNFAEPPYNGFTIMRPRFDRWFAGKAVQAGATLVSSTVVDDLLYDGANRDRVVGVKTRREDGDVTADVVIACDGVNSFLAKKAGMQKTFTSHEISLGVKEVIGLDQTVLEDRFRLTGDEGAVAEYVGDITAEVHGGGFLYTNKDSLAIGVICQLSSLAEHKQRPYELLERFKAHPAVAPLVRGGKPREYSAHLVPEAGLHMMPKLYRDGMMVAGDAAAFCFATGLYIEGINYAMQSGFAAAEAAILAHQAKDFSSASLARYKDRLDARHVLPDFKSFKSAPEYVNSERIANLYPALITRGAEQLFRVDGHGKKKIMAIARQTLKDNDVSTLNLIKDLYAGGKAFGW
jgi:electron transfer flavoprotein-quinone oxidoreductase